jgi:excisionase family DNA binding protein
MQIAIEPVPEIMDVEHCAAYLGLSKDTVYMYASTGFLPAFKLGNRWRFKKSMLEAWIVKECEKNEKDFPMVDGGGPFDAAVDRVITRVDKHLEGSLT